MGKTPIGLRDLRQRRAQWGGTIYFGTRGRANALTKSYFSGTPMSDPTARTRRPPAWTVLHRQQQHLKAVLADPGDGDTSQADIDESLEESFPASDPPSWTVRLRIGAPRRRNGVA
jgi:hypothetical protein